MLVFGFASVTEQISVAVRPSFILYGRGKLHLTSGLSVQILLRDKKGYNIDETMKIQNPLNCHSVEYLITLLYTLSNIVIINWLEIPFYVINILNVCEMCGQG